MGDLDHGRFGSGEIMDQEKFGLMEMMDQGDNDSGDIIYQG